VIPYWLGALVRRLQQRCIETSDRVCFGTAAAPRALQWLPERFCCVTHRMTFRSALRRWLSVLLQPAS
jgi:hypothetical protein